MAGTIDRDRMAAHRESTPKPGGDRLGLYKFQEGTTWVYLCGPSDAMDGLPYVEVDLHYDIGPKKKMAVCLGKQNAVLFREDTQALLLERGVEVAAEDGCEQCIAVDGKGMTPEQKKRQKAKTQYVMNFVPWAFQPPAPKAGKRKPREDLDDSERVPRQAMVGWSVWNGVCDCIEDDGDPTDPLAAVLLRVERDDSGAITEYKVSTDIESAKAPIRLPKALRTLIREHVAPGAEGDPYRLVANFTKSHEDIKALQRGEEPASKGKSGKAVSDKPACYGFDCDPVDKECIACPFKEECAEKCGVAVPGAAASKPAGRGAVAAGRKPAVDDKDDDEQEVPPPKPVAGKKPAPPPADEDEDDDPEPAPVPPKRASKPAPDPEPDDDGECDPEDEPAPPPVKAARTARAAAPAGKPAAAPAASATAAVASGEDAEDEFERELRERKARKK